MTRDCEEADWKLLRKHQAAMLEALAARINRESARILEASERGEVERYRTLSRHMEDSDRIIASCFDDWRRSTMMIFGSNLMRENLIPADVWDALSEDTRRRLEGLRDL